jgi:hypothetical protein
LAARRRRHAERMDSKKPFRMLSHDEFAKLSKDAKIAYLKAAMEAVRNNVPIIGVLVPPPDKTKY